MSEQDSNVIGPDGAPVPAKGKESALTDLVEQPAKVMRIGGMIRQLLEEVKAAPLDEASRSRLREIYDQSITELEDGLAPELVEELERLSLPFDTATPSESELRIAQAQLVGWLEGLFHGIQAALYAQQVAAQSQFQNIRLALPGGTEENGDDSNKSGKSDVAGGMYL
ncbi:MAG: bacterial proteasome activator family protein [Actinomycetota bacterium]|nr:bacterial proteasome activator family protein [Actinomycetota bacterium]